jgi:hypothetical protein
MRIVLAWPLAPPETCPRGPLGVAALASMRPPVDEPGDGSEKWPAERKARMRRAPGGRTRVIYVRVTEDEDREIRRRAGDHRRSAQRFLIETALSGSAKLSAERSRAQHDAKMARIVLTRLANNVNQLAKWANTNHAMPANMDRLVDDLGRAVSGVEETVIGLGAVFGGCRRGEMPTGHSGQPSESPGQQRTVLPISTRSSGSRSRLY